MFIHAIEESISYVDVSKIIIYILQHERFCIHSINHHGVL